MRDWEQDYGLGEGERYEPEALDEEFDLARPHVATLLGPIEPAALGMTLFCRSMADLVPGGYEDPGSILAELEAAQYMGLGGLGLDFPASCPEEQAQLIWIAQRSPVNLVMLDPSGSQRSIQWVDDNAVHSDRYFVLDDLGDVEPASLMRKSSLKLERILVGLASSAGGGSRQSLTDMMHSAPLTLMNAGYRGMEVRTVLVDNPAAALSRARTPDQEGNNES